MTTTPARVDVRFEQMTPWDLGDVTPAAHRLRPPYRATLSATMTGLRVELEWLAAASAVVELALDEEYLVGLPRLATPPPVFPGVRLLFESGIGPMQYQCDRYTQWQDNLRAIVLGMRTLRAVDRYAITRRGEQYRGFVTAGAA